MTWFDILKFVVEFIGVSSVLYLIYVVFLRYKCRYNLARIYLLFIPIVALLSVSLTFKVIPLSENSGDVIANTQFQQVEALFHNFIGETKEIINSESGHQVSESTWHKTPSNTLSEKIDSEAEVLYSAQVPSSVNDSYHNLFDIVSVLGLLYLLILLIMALSLFFQVRKIRSIKRWATCEKSNGVILYRSGLIETPFSFMRDIFVDRRVEGDKLQMIVQHELSHIANCHYWDKNIVELMSILMWFNPIVWLIRNELGAIHEFQADDSVVKGGTDIKIYQHHLFEEIMYKSPHIANGFNHSLIKKRMIMMKNSKAIKHMTLRAFTAIILSIGVFVLVSFKYVEPQDKIEIKKEQIITIISDNNLTEEKENAVEINDVVITEDVVISNDKVETSNFENVVKQETKVAVVDVIEIAKESKDVVADVKDIVVDTPNLLVDNVNDSILEQYHSIDDDLIDVRFVKDSLLSTPDMTKLQQKMQMISEKLMKILVNDNKLNGGIDYIGDNEDVVESQQQNQVLIDNDVVGTWKLKSRHSNPTKDICYKILKGDNTFINFRSDDGGKTFQTKHEGKYEVLVSGVYVECLNGGKLVTATIAYERNNDSLELEFSLGNTHYSETWESVLQTPVY